MREPAALAGRPPVRPLGVLIRIAKVLAEEKLLAWRLHHRARRMRLCDHGWPPGAEDARLLASDGFSIRPKVINVVDADTGEHRAICVDGIHRIESSTETNLEEHDIKPLAGEDPERSQRAVFEIR